MLHTFGNCSWNGQLDFNFPENLKAKLPAILKLNCNSSSEEWFDCFKEVEGYNGYLCNTSKNDAQLFPSRRWTFIHHVAYHNAPIIVLKEIVSKGMNLAFKDFEGLLPVNHVCNDATNEYKELLKPKFKYKNLDVTKVNEIEKRFHEVIISRVEDLVKKHGLVLPSILVYLESVSDDDGDGCYFSVPGFYGGFTIDFQLNADETDIESLITDSWCRVVGGSGQRHRCAADKWVLEDEGFV